MTYGRAIFRATVAAASLCFAGVAVGSTKRVEHPAPLHADRQPTAMQRYINQADAAIEAAKQSDADTAPSAEASLSVLIDDPLFTMLTKPAQRMLVSAKALATWRQGDPAGARDLFMQATRIDGNDPDEWYWLAILEGQLGDRARSARYMTALVNRWPELVNNLDPYILGDFVHNGEAGAPWRTALMQALFDAGWNDRHNGVDDIWRELALAHLQGANLPAAAQAVERISDPLVLVKVRSDKRFDTLAASVDSLPSVRDAAERRVELLREHVAESPKRVDLANTYATALLVAGRHDEALAAADTVMAAIATEDASSFEGLDAKVWVMNNRAVALRRLGRIDEALADIEAASRVEEQGTANVSQVLNLAAFYCHLGRPKDALRTVASVGSSMSGYGRMVLSSVEHCAALQSGNLQAARRALDYMLSHRNDSQAIVIEAFLRAGRIDDAAESLIGQLNDAKDRAKGLEFVQTFQTGPELAGNRTLNSNRRALLARGDVKTAVERVGRLGTHDVFDITGIE